jgi:hypothetical protein
MNDLRFLVRVSVILRRAGNRLGSKAGVILSWQETGEGL